MILVVEDEEKLASVLSDYLTLAGYQVDCIFHGDEVIDWIQQNPVKLILLDLMLPGKDGLTLCREIRTFSTVPIMMVTARVDEIDRLLGLELGADDYICKPYSPREVVARVKAVLRRSQPATASQSELDLDETKLQVAYRDKYRELTKVEFGLLKQLTEKPGLIFSRDQLMNAMYSDNRVVSDRTIDSHIKKIRRKLDQLDNSREYIQSVYGVGYRYEP